MSKIRETRNAVFLGYLEEIFTELGYQGTQLVEKSEVMPIPSVLVPLDADEEGRPRFLAVMIYPAAEFEDAVFIQYFADMPFAVPEVHLPAVYTFLPYLNHKAVVGYFGLVGPGQKPYFRYVQVLRADRRVSSEDVADVITLITTTTDMFQDIVEDVSTGKATPEQGRTRVGLLYVKPGGEGSGGAID